MDFNLVVGDEVELVDLASKPDLNGARGRLTKYLPDDDRWAVQLADSKRRLSVRLSNVRLSPAPLAIVVATKGLIGFSLATRSYAVCDGFLEDATSFCALMRSDIRDTLEASDVAGGRAAAAYARITKQAAPRGDLMRFLGAEDEVRSDALRLTLAAIDSAVEELVLRSRDLDEEWRGRGLRREEVQATCYPAGGARYVRHVDNNASLADDGRRTGRRITCILYANEAWRPGDGGELRLHPTSGAGATAVDVAPLANRFVVFFSDERVPHEVLPARAERFALSIWYHDAPRQSADTAAMGAADGGGTYAAPTTEVAEGDEAEADEGLLFDDGSLTGEAFDHTGLKRTWPAASALAHYLRQHPAEVNGQVVMELGAGSGVPSLVSATELGAARVIATDAEPQVVELLGAELRQVPTARAARLDWGDTDALHRLVREEHVGVVLAADVVYPAKDSSPLAAALAGLLHLEASAGFTPPRHVILALTKRDAVLHRAFEERLQEQLSLEGLAVVSEAEDPLYGQADVHLYRLRSRKANGQGQGIGVGEAGSDCGHQDTPADLS